VFSVAIILLHMCIYIRKCCDYNKIHIEKLVYLNFISPLDPKKKLFLECCHLRMYVCTVCVYVRMYSVCECVCVHTDGWVGGWMDG
jgi:hypothetical protein